MQSVRCPKVDRSTELITEVGGELLAGSGFEAEEPERDFTTDDLEGEA